MNNLWVQETWIDRDQNCMMGESDVYETFTSERGELYKNCVKEYGRCISRVYVDGLSNKSKPIGWVFLKRKKYDDCGETFLAETWVTIHNGPPDRTVTYHYHQEN